MKPHKHCEVIKAWADGYKVQYYINGKQLTLAQFKNKKNLIELLFSGVL